MAVQIRFDNTHNVIYPTFVLATRSGRKLGTIPAVNITVSDAFNSKFDLQFDVYKHSNGETYRLWDKLTDFAIIWCKEWDVWFEAAVTIQDNDSTVKQITCESLGEAELSQVYLYNIEINTEDDIARDDYAPTHLYDALNPKASLLTRIMEKVPHYAIAYVDDRIAGIQRTFSFDNKSIYDAFQQIAEEIDCLFIIDSGSNSDGTIKRSVSVYDLESYCNVCHKRGIFEHQCSECGSTDIASGYGKDTAVFVSSENLADEISLKTDTGSVKNCFRLECGDDLMTATVRSCNPNGSQYIWYISDKMKEDMSDELVTRLNSYDEQYAYYNEEYPIPVGGKNKFNPDRVSIGKFIDSATGEIKNNSWSTVVSSKIPTNGAGTVVTSYVTSFGKQQLQPFNVYQYRADDSLISSTLSSSVTALAQNCEYIRITTGNNFSNAEMRRRIMVELAEAETDNCTSFEAYTPICDYNVIVQKYDANQNNYTPIASAIVGYSNLINNCYDVTNLYLYLHDEMMPSITTSERTVQTELARLNSVTIPSVAVENIGSCSLSTATTAVTSVAKSMIDSAFIVSTVDAFYNSSTHKWSGKFVVTSYSDDTQSATSPATVEISITDDYETYLKQRIERILKKESDEKSINGIEELFDLNVSLSDFKAEIKKYCLNSLQAFHDSCEACVNLLIEQGVADEQTWGVSGESNLRGLLYTPYYSRLIALQDEIKLREEEIELVEETRQYLEEQREEIQNALNFQNYLGNSLWLEFIAYRREDVYKNENYISDGLTNAELIQSAQEFVGTARKEIFKSATLQHTLTATLKNLLVMKEFEPIVENFAVGNWIRVRVDGEIYKLRLINYTIDFDNLQNLSVEFSDVKQCADGITDAASVLSKASSMASSYGGVKRQASQGQQGKNTVTDWIQNGMSLSTTKIVNDSNNQNVVSDKHGMTFREHNETTDRYDDKQLKIINKGLYITDDNWASSKAAIGECQYINPQSGETQTAYGVNGEVIVGKLLLGESLGVYNEEGTMTFDDNGLDVSSSSEINGVQVVSSVVISPNNELIFKIQNGNQIILSFNKNTGALTVDGDITARTLTLGNSVTINASFINGLAAVATSGSYNDLGDTPAPVDISGKFDNPSNDASATAGQVLIKQSAGSTWGSVSGVVADNSTALINSQAVYDYALNKNQGAVNSGSFLYIDENGDVVPMTILDVKNLLGV